MSKGENIFKRKDGRWEARYIKGYELSGKIKYGFCYGKTYKEAKEKVSQYKAALIHGMPTETRHPRHRFAFYCDAWLQGRSSKVKESTYIKYKTTIEKHIRPQLGEYMPNAITTEVIDAFARELLLEKALAPKTIRDILVMLRDILKYTASFFPSVFPAVEMHYPRVSQSEIRVLSRQEQAKFIAYLLEDMDACKFGVLLALFTGIRIGELCALRWEQISLQEKTIRICATMQRLHNIDEGEVTRTHVVIGSPKSTTSSRTIPLTEYAADLCRKMFPGNLAAFILTGTQNYMEPRALQYRMRKYTRECGLEGVHLHTLRHTFATRAVEVGFEIKSLSEILGHANTKVTLDLYVHSSMELKRMNMNKLTTAGF